MIIKVELEKLHGRLLEREPFLLAEGEQAYIQCTSEFVLKNAVATYKHSCGSVSHTKKLDEKGGFWVNREHLGCGTLLVKVDLYSHGKVVRTFDVEPIVFIGGGGEIEGHPVLEVLKKENDELKSKGQVQDLAIALLKERVKRLEQQVEHIFNVLEE